MWRCRTWLCWYFIFSYYVSAQDPTVMLRQGRLVGTTIFIPNSPFPIETYFGIPYARAPIGRHRFSAPERHPGWRPNLYRAHRLPAQCPQPRHDTDRGGNFNEDCLFLNICTPRRAEVKLLPVVLLLYSKTWSYKDVTTLPCQELAAEGLVVVSAAFRLNLLGFLSFRNRIARGNLALLDQYMALMWVKENIGEFGGDPAAVTLLGHSAGADSILYHMVSPRATGLFQRAILMSPYDIWKAVDRNPRTSMDVENRSREAARTLGCSRAAVEDMMRCLQSQPIEDILRLYSSNWSTQLGPISEDFLPQTEQYLPIDLSKGLSSTDPINIDVLFGTTDLDAINVDDVEYKELISSDSSTIVDYATHQMAPELLQLHDLHHSTSLPTLIEAILWEYLGSQSSRMNGEVSHLVEGIGRARSAARWGAGAALLAAKMARRVSALYMYRYTEPGQVDLQGNLINFTGAVHGTDLIALMGDSLLQQIARRRPTTFEQRSSQYLRNYLVNFIKSGTPTMDNTWMPYRAGAAYLHEIRLFDGVQRSTSQIAASREVAFWLQYLPHLDTLHSSPERSESLNSSRDETKLRGAVYALVGVAVCLLMLLSIGAIVLRRAQNYRATTPLDD